MRDARELRAFLNDLRVERAKPCGCKGKARRACRLGAASMDGMMAALAWALGGGGPDFDHYVERVAERARRP